MTSIAKLFYLLVFIQILNAGELKINKVEPPNWWQGMKLKNIQLMVYGENLSGSEVVVPEKNIKVDQVHESDNPAYLFVDIELSENILPGNYDFLFIKNDDTTIVTYSILKREKSEGKYQGFDNSDVVYLITPDRFANGDTSNDEVEGMINDFDPGQPIKRHGGDIKGILDHLDYLKDLGITTLWVNPLVENNINVSYHGYSATDFYKIDPRFGSNELYKQLVREAHQRGLKIIWDHVSNHIGVTHPWMKSLPSKSWIHGSVENHLLAQHNKMVLSDIHADSLTYKYLTEGWFVDSMPDLNQRNAFVKNYIIENTIWWIEYSGMDGIREDTYPYSDQKFLSDWAGAILTEYPHFNIVGEVWTGQQAFLAYFQKGSYLPRDYDSNLPSVTDFGFRDVVSGYLKGEQNLYDIFQMFSKDFLYPQPDNLLTFIDNHDVERIMYAANGNIEKAKIALTILLTSRGIPQILYATEIGMVGTPDHGLLRSDFPGGFPGATHNAFTEEGRTEYEKDIFNFLKELIALRHENPALSMGNMIHLPPINDVYVYFKKYEDQLIMVAINDSGEIKSIEPWILKEAIGKYESLSNLRDSSDQYTLSENIDLSPKQASIFLIKK